MGHFSGPFPDGAPDKTGGLKIAIISDYNIAGQPTHLMRALNKYSRHRARTIIIRDDFLKYDQDIILELEPGRLDPEAVQAATEIINEADFFHFGRGIYTWTGLPEWDKKLTPRNCLVKYYGSELRGNPRKAEFHKQTGIPAVTGSDWTINAVLPGGYYHLGSYFTFFGDMPEDKIPGVNHHVEESWVFAGSGGSPLKRYDLLDKAVQELVDEGVKIRIKVVHGQPNYKALEEKADCQICFGSLHGGGWGISGVESLWMKQPVLTALDPFFLSLFPDQTALPVDASTLKERLRRLALNRNFRNYLGDMGREFCRRHFRTDHILVRYLYLIDHIMNADKLAQGAPPVPEIYDFYD